MRGFEKRLQARLDECHVATAIEHAHRTTPTRR